MKKLDLNDPVTKSADIIAENVDKLKALFPDALKEGKIDFDVLKQLLAGEIEEREEKYGLNWHGKRRARQLALTPSAGTLRPCSEDSLSWEVAQNLVIEGDNLETLKLLQKSYTNKIQLIYIDPPYNTGNDFIYPDSFQESIRNYLELTGQVDAGKKLSSNPEASGRFHTDWLNMIYPRLKLSHGMLAEDGVILVSIDDNESHNMRQVLQEIYGQENFIGQIVWRGGRRNAAKVISTSHDYVIAYAKNLQHCINRQILWREKKQGLPEIYKKAKECVAQAKGDYTSASALFQKWISDLPDNSPSKDHEHYKWIDDKGVYFAADISRGGGGGPRWNIKNPKTNETVQTPERGWAYSKIEELDNDILNNLIHFNGSSVPCKKTYLKDNESQLIDTVFYKDRRGGSKRLRSLMEADCFNFPKDEQVLTGLVAAFTRTNAIVLDFFAGSGTTGHAVMAQNIADTGNRRYVLIQLPEPLDPDNEDQKVAAAYCDKLKKPRTIAELTKERLRRAAKKLQEENPEYRGDLGFRVFKLDSSNIRAWEPDRDKLAQSLEESVEHIKSDRTEQDILYELLLKLGLDLCVPIEVKKIKGSGKKSHEVHSIGAGALLVCLSALVPKEDVEPLALGIAALHKALKPSGETTVVFRDSAFADDVAKTNLTAILEQNGLSNIRSL
jgi:adenine-specific DNA-methyltransferase